MAIVSVSTIKSWFKTSFKPTQQQFSDVWDSYRHKSEIIPISSIESLDERFDDKADAEAFSAHIKDDDAHNDLFSKKINLVDIYSALDCVNEGKVLDARQGKVLNDAIVQLRRYAEDSNNKDQPGGYLGIKDDGMINSSTSNLTEGSNLYFTDSRVLSALATGLAATVGTPISTDSIIVVLSKLKNFLDNIGTTVRATQMTGIINSTNQVTSSDSLITSIGKLQGQLNAKQGAMSIASDSEIQNGQENTKYVTSQRINSWFTWLKSQAQIINARWTFGILRMSPSDVPSVILDGDIWHENSTRRLRFKKSTQTVDMLFSADNMLLQGVGDRILQSNSVGDITAPNEIVDLDVTDLDVISAILGATYNLGNNFTSNIAPSGKFFYSGQRYKSGQYLYIAVQDNTVFRISGG